ncbi:SRR1-like protein isoform X2 [Rhinatrema bivittatum]|nr:SRR1-like protein isoform X2 [Rhinatrema bivittatum]XP_029475285.1 SRR1-like protein isoform X2 [Rhinatrema bivittatum]XP_029475286.1 SRR1-like protein isoform X2 [Rhinatrema bivittatum]
MEDCPWQTVSGKKGAKKQINKTRTVTSSEESASSGTGCQDDEVDCDKIKLRIQQAKEELTASTFWYLCQRLIHECLGKFLEQTKEKRTSSVEDIHQAYKNSEDSTSPESVHQQDTQSASDPRKGTFHSEQDLNCVCYGVGKFSTCVISRYQLAFLLLLLEKLQIPAHRCRVFDPLFSKWEIEVLQALGLTVILENEEGKRRIFAPTIFYMIHCGKALYNNLLWRNWSVDALSKVIIIGNSFQRIEERLLARILMRDYIYISQILKRTEEAAFPDDPRYLDVFSDTSVHWFPVQKLKEVPSANWLLAEEPAYLECEDLEIIKNRDKNPSSSACN